MPSFSRPPKAPAGDSSEPTSDATQKQNLGSDNAPHLIEQSHPDSPATSKQWKTLRKQILSCPESRTAAAIFGASCGKGRIYRWGVSTATNQPCSDLQELLAALAADQTSPKQLSVVDLPLAANQLQDAFSTNSDELRHASDAVLWAAAMPQLLHHLSEAEWWNLLGTLQDFRDTISHQDRSRPQSLVAVAELGLTLAWRLSALPSCRRLQSSSLTAMQDWFDRSEESITNAVCRPSDLRLTLASLIRSKSILQFLDLQTDGKTSKTQTKKARKPSWIKSYDKVSAELTTWCISLLRQDGTQTLTDVSKRHVTDDRCDDGLLQESAKFERSTLGPAVSAAMGDDSEDGRLAWIAGLPESMLHDEEANLACLLPDWDVRRSRLILRYNQSDVSIEMLAGQSSVISGTMQTHISIDNEVQSPNGKWIVSCEYTDDDVHYLELEIPYTGGYVLQRQFMLIREDRCCFVADAVLRGHQNQQAQSLPSAIGYQLRLPIGQSIECKSMKETTEVFLCDRKRRALVLPLSAAEWQNQQTQTTLSTSQDDHLVVQASGNGQLYVPLWFDFYRSRFRLKRTWRSLTVAQNLQTTPKSDAAAYRIQTGSEQWVLYRSLIDRIPRTFMGKHMIADFYCSRFDARKQSHEDLITVDDDLDGAKKPNEAEKGD